MTKNKAKSASYTIEELKEAIENNSQNIETILKTCPELINETHHGYYRHTPYYPMYAALSTGDKFILELLIKNGAEINSVVMSYAMRMPKGGLVLLDVIEEREDIDICKIINTEINYGPYRKETPLDIILADAMCRKCPTGVKFSTRMVSSENEFSFQKATEKCYIQYAKNSFPNNDVELFKNLLQMRANYNKDVSTDTLLSFPKYVEERLLSDLRQGKLGEAGKELCELAQKLDFYKDNSSVLQGILNIVEEKEKAQEPSSVTAHREEKKLD